ncbi:MAG TPA: methyltransferase [Terriglobia bacterium]|nr:methyltransferase [Terriglobia bacterium]
MAVTAVAGQNSALTEMAMGYFRSRVLCAAAGLGLADALGDEERTVKDLAAVCGAERAALYRLLRALASFGVVAETSPESFVLTPLGKPLRKDATDSAWAGIVFWADLLADEWSHLTECIRTGQKAAAVRPPGVPSRWSQDPDASAVFRAVMGTSPAEDYMPIARAWDFSKYHRVADLGGGGGALIAAVLEAFPHVQGVLVDRPESIDRAAPRFEGLAGRCRLVAADLTTEVPPGAEVYMLKHVLHGYEDGAAAEILRQCRTVLLAEGLPAEGRVLVIEFVLLEVVDHPDRDLEQRLMSDLNMLAVTGGKERSAAEWRQLLASAGLKCERIIPVPGDLVSIIEAAPAG